MKRSWRIFLIGIFIFAIVTFFSIGFANRSFAWGTGHHVIGRAVAERLPSPWKEKLTGANLAIFLQDNHYPDSLEPIKNENRFTQEDLAQFGQYGMKVRFAFHSLIGRAIAFERLAEAIRQKDDARTFLFLGVLAHVIADQTACNHEAFIHYATYNLGIEGMKIVPNLPLDLGWIGGSDFRQAVFNAELDKISLRDPTDSPKKIYQDLFFYEWEGTESFSNAAELFKYSVRCASDPIDQENEKNLAMQLSRLGTWGVERILYVFSAAVNFACSKADIQYKNDYLEGYEERVSNYLKSRPLTLESFAIPYLPKNGKFPEIAVLFNSLGKMNEGMFNFLNRVQGYQICHTLKGEKDIALWDLREFLARGFGSANGQPKLLIVPAQNCVDYYFMKKSDLFAKLANYLAEGGKILWIGTIPPDAISPGLSKLVRKNDDKDDYNNPVYPVSIDRLMRSVIRTADGAHQWHFTHVPKGKAGWIWPRCRYYLTEPSQDQFKPILYLDSPHAKIEKESLKQEKVREPLLDRKVTGFVRPATNPNFGWLPSYAIFPYLLTNESPNFQNLDLSLDSASKTILKTALQELGIDVK